MTTANPASPGEQVPPRLTIIAVPFRLNNLQLEVGHRANTPYGTTLITGHPLASESLDETATRLITQWIGTKPQYIEQLYTVSIDRGQQREVAVSYVALFRLDSSHAPGDDRMYWSPATELQINDEMHRMVFDYALVRLKAKLGYTNIAFHLLPEVFTLSDLQQTYETVLGHPVDKRNFRRRMAASGTLTTTRQMRRDGNHRPAALYQFVAQDDHAEYLTPSWASATLTHRQNSGESTEN